MASTLILVLDVDVSTVHRAAEFAIRGAAFESSSNYSQMEPFPPTVETIWMLDSLERGRLQQIKQMRQKAARSNICFFSGPLSRLEEFLSSKLPLLTVNARLSEIALSERRADTGELAAAQAQKLQDLALRLTSQHDRWLLLNMRWPCDLDYESQRLLEVYCRKFPKVVMRDASTMKQRIQRLLEMAGILPTKNKRCRYTRAV